MKTDKGENEQIHRGGDKNSPPKQLCLRQEQQNRTNFNQSCELENSVEGRTFSKYTQQ